MDASERLAVRGEAMRERGRMAELYRAHASDAFRVAYLVTGDRSLAEDLTHEAFIRVAGRFHDLRNRSAFGSYLRTAVVNLAHSHFRRTRLERNYLKTQRTGELSTETPEPRDDLRSALLSLPVRQRTAVVLRFYEDLSEVQTAEAMGTSPAAVKSLVARAMESLRTKVEDDRWSKGRS